MIVYSFMEYDALALPKSFSTQISKKAKMILYYGFVQIFLILILTLLLFGTGAYALDSKIPKEGTVFVGENDLDISDCNVRAGDEIAFWSSGPEEHLTPCESNGYPAFFCGSCILFR